MSTHIVSSGGAVAWGKHYDPPQGAYVVWELPDGSQELFDPPLTLEEAEQHEC